MRMAGAVLALGCTALPGHVTAAPDDVRALAELSLEQLMNVKVSSLSKRSEPQFRAPAAIYVLTAEAIRQAGVTSLPDALRLVPGVQVEQVGASQWSVGIRGFGSRLSRGMLVLIDGRSVYNPLFAGVYWEDQDTLLADVERIEVVRGPGGTVWGTNAVNGVINIITRSASATQGEHLELGTASDASASAAYRHGTTLGQTGHIRGYARYADHGPLQNPAGPEFDDWRLGQAGFRADWDTDPARTFTLQGDAYHGRLGAQTDTASNIPPFAHTVDPFNDTETLGGNLLARWEGTRAGGGSWRLQSSYSCAQRNEELFSFTADTLDLDFSAQNAAHGRHTLLWGTAYRYVHQNSDGEPGTRFTPAARGDVVWSAFAQDDIALWAERAGLSVGTKVEHNDYSGFEFQPSVRAWWAPAERHFLWTSATRAVRTPSRVEHDLALTAFAPEFGGFVRVVGDGSFRPEETRAFELGYRFVSGTALAVDVAAFYNEFRNLLTADLGTPFVEASPGPAHLVLPFILSNHARGSAHGVELALRWSPAPRWQLDLAYAYTQLALRPTAPGALAAGIESVQDGTPHHAASVRSHLSLTRDWSWDLVVRYVDSIAGLDVPAYTELDTRLNWQLTPRFALDLTGRNLLDHSHPERPGSGLEVRRTALLRGTWTW